MAGKRQKETLRITLSLFLAVPLSPRSATEAISSACDGLIGRIPIHLGWNALIRATRTRKLDIEFQFVSEAVSASV
uniref:Putative secreted peptide n=1 Tax=Anopheles braziliensis TaxID=58242 RepID=A0A2M3ZX91_9DIPT